ncbi:hypothetical protein [Streptomyces sp. DSM 118148]|uniref:hypothetical protein n=1 Tax=Streptomyces sp. DSM 118148 TaxID=3448667 RepID=UPI00403FEC43
MFTVPLAGGFATVVHFNCGGEFTTTDYFLTHPEWSQDLVLASDDQDRIGPGLCWPKVAALLEAPPGAAGITDPHVHLLLDAFDPLVVESAAALARHLQQGRDRRLAVLEWFAEAGTPTGRCRSRRWQPCARPWCGSCSARRRSGWWSSRAPRPGPARKDRTRCTRPSASS